jgi:hypothetical protein
MEVATSYLPSSMPRERNTGERERESMVYGGFFISEAQVMVGEWDYGSTIVWWLA